MKINACKAMVKENNFCVLSTCKDNLTNSSLMLYLSDEEGTKLYMLTLKGSMKYTNMEENPDVSLLIDTREHIFDDEPHVKALTVYGRSMIIRDEKLNQEIIVKLVDRHPSLKALASMDKVTVVQVEVKSFLYLDGVNDAEYITVRKNGEADGRRL